MRSAFMVVSLVIFQPTLPARGATAQLVRADGHLTISTHAPRTGSDPSCRPRRSWRSDFNPRSPHGERHSGSWSAAGAGDFNPRSPHGERLGDGGVFDVRRLFQPTLPARGATHVNAFIARAGLISTHAPRTGSDLFNIFNYVRFLLFQPTLPARGATSFVEPLEVLFAISTHAPRTGSDYRYLMLAYIERNFNPRSPHGERQRHFGNIQFQLLFQPTLPARGATGAWGMRRRPKRFQPTLPARGATVGISYKYADLLISTHAPRTGSDKDFARRNCTARISTHAPRTGSDHFSALHQ